VSVHGPRAVGDTEVHPVALGGMLLSIEGRPPTERAVATVRAALEAGATLVDTADAYHAGADEVGHNEALVRRAVDGVRPAPMVATKGGRVRPGDGRWLTDASPAHLRAAAQASYERLGGVAMDLYQLHAPDPEVPYEQSLLALRDVVDEGLARQAGVSNVDASQLELAVEVLGDRLVSVQNQYSPTHRGTEDTLRLSEQAGLAFLAWRPLGAVRDPGSPVGAAFARTARERGVSVPRLVLAWHLATSPAVVPLVGATRPETAVDSVAAADLDLSAEELGRLG